MLTTKSSNVDKHKTIEVLYARKTLTVLTLLTLYAKKIAKNKTGK